MRARMMIVKEYEDTRTGERFDAWRSVAGWRLQLLAALARGLTAGRATFERRTGYACLALAALLLPFALTGCGAPKVRAEAQPQATQTVQFEARTAEERAQKPAIHCGAPTKVGGKCKRRVRAEGLRCFMHQK